MIQTEQNFERSQTSAPMTRTRCPQCLKLFAVETQTLHAMALAGVTRAEFTCTGDLCHEAFAIELPLPEARDLGVIPALSLDRLFIESPPIESPLLQSPTTNTQLRVPSSTAVEAASLKTASRSATSKDFAVSERECPRCGAANVATSADCARCGIVFERIHDDRIEEELALGGTRELSALWDKTLEDYEDRIRHDRFLNAARDAGALSYAAKKYSQILVAVPQDDIARLMRNRIVAMISILSESARMPFRLNFRIPKINSMALFGGSVLFFWGLFMPQLKSIMEIGLSLMLLAIGVRIALRARI